MFRVKSNTKPEAFENKFEIVHHWHSEINFIEPKIYKVAPPNMSLNGKSQQYLQSMSNPKNLS